MDYMLELARHPDLLEAIDMEPARSAEGAAALRRVSFLATEYPNSWIVEVVHQFYAHPELASQVWVNLRYCASFRRELAEREVQEESKGWNAWWESSTDREKRIHKKTSEYSGNPQYVHELCRKHQAFPDPPTFLHDLVPPDDPAEARDDLIRKLLARPKEVRAAAVRKKMAVPFSIVQEGELDQIRRNRAALGTAVAAESASASNASKRHSSRLAMDGQLLGLAFSGGGIRSATFNLGVLQALSKIGLLKHVDYLSTVSGGGYIGTWLAGWIRRELDAVQQRVDDKELDEETGRRIAPIVMADMQRRLSPVRSPNPMDERVRPIRFLREYSNYLTPKTGFLSSDTWTMIGIYVRNTLLNQVIIVSLFAAALLLPRNWFAGSALVSGSFVPVGVAALLWAFGAYRLIKNLRRLDPRDADRIAAGESMSPRATKSPPRYAHPLAVHWLIVLPWLLACALVARPLGEWALWDGGPFGTVDDAATATGPNLVTAATWIGVIVAVSFLVILLAGRTDRCWTAARKGGESWTKALLAITGSAVVAGAVGAGLVWVLLRLLLVREQAHLTELTWHLNGIVTPGLMSVVSLAIVALLGMLGRQFPDEHREWWSRLRTVIHIYAVGWFAWFVMAVYVPWFIHALAARGFGLKSAVTALATWLASTLLGVRIGPKAEEDRKQQSESEAPPALSATLLRYAALVAPYAFVVGLIVGISLGVDALYRQNAPQDLTRGLDQHLGGAYWTFATWTTHTCWMWTLACAAIGLVFSWRVDINEFSIHHFYKNRLVRCYLGASHTGRKADWFTGFDPKDDLPLRRFDHADKDGLPHYAGPYPIINCALNLVGGKDLAWQERKATSFVFTPKYCGYDADRAVLTKGSEQSSEGYVPTRAFYHADEGPLLGMAMAISGAAANPNMGRASSPALAFLMTVFNVRLGWWIGNPRHRKGASKSGPHFGLTYTALELFGATDDERKFVNLSDGGHFDNLGVYELIRRSCRYIIVCDAGQDAELVCEDLGDLVRRCRTDFGVEIDIALDRIRQRDSAGLSQTHCVVGEIHYLNIPKRVRKNPLADGDDDDRLVAEDGGPVMPGCRPEHEKGYLIYIKPSMTGDEPQDVLEYYRRIPEFPHQSTADQWFGESQFESYRKLGMHVAEDTFARYQDDDTQGIESVQQLFERLHRYWYPPSVAIGQRSSQHAEEYSRIMEMVRQTPGLEGLDRTMFEGLPPNGGPVAQRDEFYICNALVQLIENVYADLDLEHNWNHPHVEGWMEVFRRWAQQPAFRRTWKVSEATYAERFRNFYNDRLRGRGLGLPKSFIASHRGRVKPSTAPGNTLADFDRAVEAGATVVELDVRKLSSGELIVCHDDKISGHEVATTTLEDLEAERVPVLTLAKCLNHLRGEVRLNLELKVPGIERDVVTALKNCDWPLSDVVLTSFDPEIAKAVRAVSSEVRVGVLVKKHEDYLKLFEDFLLTEADFLAPRESWIDRKELIRAEHARVPLVPWTVNDEQRLRLFLGHAAVAGVMTEDVELALRVKRQM